MEEDSKKDLEMIKLTMESKKNDIIDFIIDNIMQVHMEFPEMVKKRYVKKKKRKKFNQTYNHFYSISQNEQKSNKTINNTNSNLVIKSTINDISNKFDTSDYSTLNPYWNKRNHDNIKKIYKIKSDLFQKAQKEMKSIPKINQKSKRIANNSSKNESTSDVHYNNIYDKLFHMSYIRSLKSCTNNKKRNNKPKINEKSEKMKRTIDDLYSWTDKRKLK